LDLLQRAPPTALRSDRTSNPPRRDLVSPDGLQQAIPTVTTPPLPLPINGEVANLTISRKVGRTPSLRVIGKGTGVLEDRWYPLLCPQYPRIEVLRKGLIRSPTGIRAYELAVWVSPYRIPPNLERLSISSSVLRDLGVSLVPSASLRG
jgi:hypothetical protein